jgi:endonuclease/exonuclease/phosphatase (EEP) superfamily protein YafD
MINNLLTVATLSLLCAGCASTRAPETPPGRHLKLLTFNVNWGAPRPDLAIQAIRQSKADVVCLQETTPEWEQLLRRELSSEYPFMEFRQSKNRAGGGLAFLARKAGHEVAYVPSDTGWFDGWIKAFNTDAGTVQVLNVHLRPPVSDRGSFASGYFGTGDDRLREMERFVAHVRTDLPLIVAGDFNDHERSPVVRWLEDRKMRNALPEFDRSTPTWQWRYRFVTFRRRMDHILYPPEVHCYSARVLPLGASDHFPVEAVLSVR